MLFRWEAKAFTAVSFFVPDNWKAGRIWVRMISTAIETPTHIPLQGRRNCDFNRAGGPSVQCLTGGCNGGLLCDERTGTGVPPASLAEVGSRHATLNTQRLKNIYSSHSKETVTRTGTMSRSLMVPTYLSGKQNMPQPIADANLLAGLPTIKDAVSLTALSILVRIAPPS